MRCLKKKLIIIIIVNLLFLTLVYGFFTAFNPQYSKAEIKQKIGDVLICNSEYNADIHSWQYDVIYSYKNKEGKTFKIGEGTYYGREWEKNEQLIVWNGWTILKTGGWIGTDKIIIGNFRKKTWPSYEFTPDSIEKNEIWIHSKTHSLLNYCCATAFILNISNGIIEVRYNFRTSESNPEKMDSRKIIYRIEPKTGVPMMLKILN